MAGATNSCACQWQHELLSFAQVCRQWSQYSMRLLVARLESGEWKNHLPSFSHSLSHVAFAETLRKTPFLGLGVQHLDLEQHTGSEWACRDHASQKPPPDFSQALIAVLRATKNLQRSHLSLGYSAQAHARFSSLPELDDLHTLSITRRTTCRLTSRPPTECWKYSVSTIQLARCMARWPASLTSLTVEHLIAGNIGRWWTRCGACRR
jgi:hypothetical protein